MPNYISHGIPLFNIIHTKLRYSLTQLNYDLFKYGLTNDISCNCGYFCEDNHQYMLSCMLYNRQRNVLFETINHIVNGTVILDLSLLLYGNADLTNVQNENIFTAVQLYIKKSKRFT